MTMFKWRDVFLSASSSALDILPITPKKSSILLLLLSICGILNLIETSLIAWQKCLKNHHTLWLHIFKMDLLSWNKFSSTSLQIRPVKIMPLLQFAELFTLSTLQCLIKFLWIVWWRWCLSRETKERKELLWNVSSSSILRPLTWFCLIVKCSRK